MRPSAITEEASAPGVRAWLEALHRLRVSAEPPTPRPPGWRHATVEALLLTHGRAWAWTPGRRPPGIRRGPGRPCFRNAFQLALRRPALTYAEGYAAGIVPVHHAWCGTPEGRVVDPTWRPWAGERTREYFGVAFRTGWVARVVVQQRASSVLDAWRADFPVMTDDPAEFLAAFPAARASRSALPASVPDGPRDAAARGVGRRPRLHPGGAP